ncbi:MAG: hypothetical protein V4694_04055 [Pseudomonadota bacterium]
MNRNHKNTEKYFSALEEISKRNYHKKAAADLAEYLNNLAQDFESLYKNSKADRIKEIITNPQIFDELVPQMQPLQLAKFLGGAKKFLKKNDLQKSSIECLRDSFLNALFSEKPSEISESFADLVQMEFTKEDFGNLDQKQIVRAVNKILAIENTFDISATLGGLLNFGFIDRNFLNFLVIPSFKKQEMSRSHDFAAFYSLLRFEFYCQKILGTNFFSEEFIKKIAAEIPKKNTDNVKSELQHNIAEFLQTQAGCEVSEEVMQNFYGAPVLETDIVLHKDDVKFFIEVDGPSHFYENEKGEYLLTHKTLVRNQMYEALVREKIEDGDKIIFVDLPFFEIRKANRENNLGKYLEEKLGVKF